MRIVLRQKVVIRKAEGQNQRNRMLEKPGQGVIARITQLER